MIMSKQGKGTADHILPLGDWFKITLCRSKCELGSSSKVIFVELKKSSIFDTTTDNGMKFYCFWKLLEPLKDLFGAPNDLLNPLSDLPEPPNDLPKPLSDIP